MDGDVCRGMPEWVAIAKRLSECEVVSWRLKLRERIARVSRD